MRTFRACNRDNAASHVYAEPVLVTTVQSEQIRILQAHGHLTTPRISHVLEYQADALKWVADNWQSSRTPQDNFEVQQVAAEALAFVTSSRLLDPDE